MTFRGRTILRRLDSGRKPFREVYLCSSPERGRQVLILYINRRTPLCMYEFGTACPMEYFKRIHLRGTQGEGLPELFDYGQSLLYSWIFEEYLDGTETLGEALGGLDMQGKEGAERLDRLLESFRKALSTPLLSAHGAAGDGLMITPDSIRLGRDKDGNSHVCFVGLDEMIAPQYYDREEIYSYYDLRYAPPEVLRGEEGPTDYSYSVVLALLAAIEGMFPFDMLPPCGETGKLHPPKHSRAWTVLPAGYRESLGKCLHRDRHRRIGLGAAMDELLMRGHGHNTDSVSIVRSAGKVFIEIPDPGVTIPFNKTPLN